METVAAHAGVKQGLWQRKTLIQLRLGLVIRRIETAYVGNICKCCACGSDAGEIVRLVQRRKLFERGNIGQYPIIDDDRARKNAASMNNAVPYCHHPAVRFSLCQPVENGGHGVDMRWRGFRLADERRIVQRCSIAVTDLERRWSTKSNAKTFDLPSKRR